MKRTNITFKRRLSLQPPFESQLVLRDVKKMRIIELEEHNEKWSKVFDNEVGVIKAILKENIVAASHIGSTAILGIRAKPVIDILLEARSLNEVDKHNKVLEELGYEAKGEYGIKGRRFFQKGKNERTHHLHIFESGNPEIERHRLYKTT